ncbi:hypothetical protein HDU80_011354 [Chytriomyces hyalinus]|nr:hypothetical protein HDU80_011354 [Chytriomyces hyalinus]
MEYALGCVCGVGGVMLTFIVRIKRPFEQPNHTRQHSQPNADAASEIELIREAEPAVDIPLSNKLVAVFGDLRKAFDEGSITYPYSLRELLNIVRHISAFPRDSLGQVIHVGMIWIEENAASSFIQSINRNRKDSKGVENNGLVRFCKTLQSRSAASRAAETPAAKPPTLASTLNLTPAVSPIQPYPPSNMRAYPITSKTATVMDVHVIAHISSQLHQLKSKPSTIACITLAKLFKNVIGIELDRDSISWARQNALDNGLHDETVVRFISGDVSDLFQGAVESMVQQQLQHSKSMVNSQTIGDDIALVLDLPKKGCSLDFMHQVMPLNPAFIVYVSCNPASQVKDLQIKRNYAREGVPPASFKGSVGRLLKGENEAGRVQSELGNSRVLYLGGKKIMRNSVNGVAEVSVEDVARSSDHVRGVAPVTLLKVKGYRVLNFCRSALTEPSIHIQMSRQENLVAIHENTRTLAELDEILKSQLATKCSLEDSITCTKYSIANSKVRAAILQDFSLSLDSQENEGPGRIQSRIGNKEC